MGNLLLALLVLAIASAVLREGLIRDAQHRGMNPRPWPHLRWLLAHPVPAQLDRPGWLVLLRGAVILAALAAGAGVVLWLVSGDALSTQ